MPVIKSAKKKLRKDKKLQKHNYLIKSALSSALKTARKNPTADSVKKAVILADKAAKKNIVHKNKAARIKSRLSKLVKQPAKTKTKTEKTPSKTPKAKK